VYVIRDAYTALFDLEERIMTNWKYHIVRCDGPGRWKHYASGGQMVTGYCDNSVMSWNRKRATELAQVDGWRVITSGFWRRLITGYTGHHVCPACLAVQAELTNINKNPDPTSLPVIWHTVRKMTDTESES
jgi:hypothetical protein